ncbi:GNAT family N-acetyltransferase [Paludibacter jiangxiensis]|uniref:Ribosomal protein S18 acetylase RimI n=1 Tax=Paludibacter jiangxiensis TaxID=681398 RepID=A0A161LTF9_9BACT|nr:GNAT family N-acetyltransferase [Paludibacter jiangxiensis]GAT64250.1 ribosomal protein S18 acetylase RimI [Paludibacter jiangxiensis]
MTIQYTSFAYTESYCRAVDVVARERQYLGATEGFPLDASFSFAKTIIENNLAQYFAIDNNQVVGWCDIIPKSYEGLGHVGVLGMGVISEYRGKGLGTLLLQKTIEHARNINHLEKVELDVFESNSSAIARYRKFGFEVEGKRENGRKLDDVYDNILLMRKFI